LLNEPTINSLFVVVIAVLPVSAVPLFPLLNEVLSRVFELANPENSWTLTEIVLAVVTTTVTTPPPPIMFSAYHCSTVLPDPSVLALANL
jgi:hypothetical protein